VASFVERKTFSSCRKDCLRGTGREAVFRDWQLWKSWTLKEAPKEVQAYRRVKLRKRRQSPHPGHFLICSLMTVRSSIVTVRVFGRKCSVVVSDIGLKMITSSAELWAINFKRFGCLLAARIALFTSLSPQVRLSSP
jgi:hypothetical protein